MEQVGLGGIQLSSGLSYLITGNYHLTIVILSSAKSLLEESLNTIANDLFTLHIRLTPRTNWRPLQIQRKITSACCQYGWYLILSLNVGESDNTGDRFQSLAVVPNITNNKHTLPLLLLFIQLQRNTIIIICFTLTSCFPALADNSCCLDLLRPPSSELGGEAVPASSASPTVVRR